MKNSIVFVLGMHRSGTSMLTNMVEKSGYHCGDNLQPPGSDNPNGYWEDLKVLRINERLLRALGKNWSSLGIPSLDDIQNLDCFSALKSEACDYLSAQLKQHNKLAIKDPRLCILLPFWLSVVKELDAHARFLVIKRDAASIVASLVKRDAMDPVYAMQLILCYWVQIAFHLVSSDYHWTWVDYGSIGSPEHRTKLAKQLAEFLAVDSQVVHAALANYKSELNHAKPQKTRPATIAFDFQQNFCEAFPCKMTEAEFMQYQSLSTIHAAMSFWGDGKAIIQKIAQSVECFSANLSDDSYVLYGAGTVAKTLLMHLSEKLAFGIDKSVEDKTQIYDMDFYPVSHLKAIQDVTILVSVTGRKTEIRHTLKPFNHKIIFIEDYFNDHTNY